MATTTRPKILIDVGIYEALKKSAEKNTSSDTIRPTSPKTMEPKEHIMSPPASPSSSAKNTPEASAPIRNVHFPEFTSWMDYAKSISSDHRPEARRILKRIRNSHHFDMADGGYLMHNKKNTNIVFVYAFTQMFSAGKPSKDAVQLVNLLKKSNIIKDNWKNTYGQDFSRKSKKPDALPSIPQSAKPPPWYQITS